MRNYWIGWTSTEEHGQFSLRSPWWVSSNAVSDRLNSSLGKKTNNIVAAVQAESLEEAKKVVEDSYVTTGTPVIKFRFATEIRGELPWKRTGSPFNLEDWMDWK